MAMQELRTRQAHVDDSRTMASVAVQPLHGGPLSVPMPPQDFMWWGCNNFASRPTSDLTDGNFAAGQAPWWTALLRGNFASPVYSTGRVGSFAS